jgi:hypothetical protein
VFPSFFGLQSEATTFTPRPQTYFVARDDRPCITRSRVLCLPSMPCHSVISSRR